MKKERESRWMLRRRAELVRLGEQTKTDRAKISEPGDAGQGARKKVACWFASQKQ